jgi:hypothetical protein
MFRSPRLFREDYAGEGSESIDIRSIFVGKLFFAQERQNALKATGGVLGCILP